MNTEETSTAPADAVVRPHGLSSNAAQAWELIQVGWVVVFTISPYGQRAELRKVVAGNHAIYISKQPLPVRSLRELIKVSAVMKINEYEINEVIHRVYASS